MATMTNCISFFHTGVLNLAGEKDVGMQCLEHKDDRDLITLGKCI